MRAWSASILFGLCGAAASAAEDRAERFLDAERVAFEHYNRKDWNAAIAAFERQIAVFPGNPRPYYNIACCHGLQGDAERAGTWISLAVSFGFRDAAHLAADSDFDRVRESPGFRSAAAEMERAAREEGPLLPRLLPAASAPLFRSAQAILDRHSSEEEEISGSLGRLLEEHQLRRRLFDVWSRQIAALDRYLLARAGAPDADAAAAQKVETAARVLERAGAGEEDRSLREYAAALVRRFAEEFVRGWPQSGRLSLVRRIRAVALARTGAPGAAEALRSVADDCPSDGNGWIALVELCRLEASKRDLDPLRRDYARLLEWTRALAGGDGGAGPAPDERLRSLLPGELFEARLLVEGFPLPRPPGARACLFVFPLEGDETAEEWLRLARELQESHPAFRGVVWIVTETGEAWIAEHAKGLTLGQAAPGGTRGLGIPRIPAAVLVDGDGALLSLDPGPEELRRIVGERCR